VPAAEEEAMKKNAWEKGDINPPDVERRQDFMDGQGGPRKGIIDITRNKEGEG